MKNDQIAAQEGPIPALGTETKETSGNPPVSGHDLAAPLSPPPPTPTWSVVGDAQPPVLAPLPELVLHEDHLSRAHLLRLLDERDLIKRAEMAREIGWTLTPGSMPVPPLCSSKPLTQAQSDFIGRLHAPLPKVGSEPYCERMLGGLLRTPDGLDLIGEYPHPPSPDYPRICPVDFEVPAHHFILAAAAVAIKKQRAGKTVSRQAVEAGLQIGFAVSYGDEAAKVAEREGPSLHDTLDRIYADDPPELNEFLFAERQVQTARILVERKFQPRARSPLERWLYGRRLLAIEQRHPQRVSDDAYAEEIGKLAGLRIGCATKAVLFDPETKPPKVEPVLRLGQAVVAKPGNLVTISAPVKSGKSATVAAIIASTMAIAPDCDCLGFRSENLKGLAVVHVDTEQDEDDHDLLARGALTRAREKKPSWFLSYSLRELSIEGRLAFIRNALTTARDTFGGILMVLIDGVADLITNVNDTEKAPALVHELLRLSSEFKTVIVCVLHENPGSDFGKTRGHLGSELERKSMSNLRLKKEDDGVTTIWGDKMRKAEIPKSAGVRFRWNDDAAMHLVVKEEDRIEAQKAQLRQLALAIFAAQDEMPYKSALRHIEAIEKVEERQAKTRFTALKDHGMVIQPDGKRGQPWTLGPEAKEPKKREPVENVVPYVAPGRVAS